jgi:uncharacterized protein
MRVHHDWFLTPQRLAVHLPTATGVVADLHLGYNQARQRGGEAVPSVDLERLLVPLARAIASCGVRHLVIAGDLFEVAFDEDLVGELLAWLKVRCVELLGVIPGNHDRAMPDDRAAFPICSAGVTLGEWHVVHGDGDLGDERLVHGHFHPCLRLRNQLAVPCYLTSPNRLLLPAFSPDARGVNVLGAPGWQRFRCYVAVGSEVLDFGEVNRIRNWHRAAVDLQA